ncbi:threonine-phosphate decarboxylase CobD [Paraburkholderia sp. SEWSISQ10-3 4]|uniref:threonine-phosphate decarboxylase CobD n=1 Tax=Paraburkholderia TaxID=1822464 RepID=UPI00225B2717|nr:MULTISPECIES: threonine-phosphate decarboxylase CobD [Paraburkholderia]MCX4143524.1 threonine-phosphate decarboxylase CobD [Paraburkholderia aspalathi]MDN7176197.1 threonine-phosphate decarboxylase CobD [Paraburkholderia sp. SEWSISQ10-3 4]MDQ6505838.1 threonine-phosphate decarboxylase CobD [Paraburkholderia aspalathi]
MVDRMVERTTNSGTTFNAVVHGGNLHEAAERYGIPYAQWLDLSTGINPHGYPVPPVPADAWRRLPDDGDDFAACAARYYGAPDAAHVLPVAGSQAAIRALPVLLPRARVGIAPLTYSEYAPAFERAGHEVVPLDVSWDTLPDALTHVVVVNPNNPTAEHLNADKLLRWHKQLIARGGTLLIDEAFADTMPSASLAASTHRDGLIVLRSPGKFFGLAGVRSGFVLGAPSLLDALRLTLGAWTVSGPARHAVKAAFEDVAWQQQMRTLLEAESARLVSLLQAHGFATHSTPLFAWTDDARAAALHEALAQRGVWTRLFTATGSVRFGLPASDTEWTRFEESLREAVR